MTEDGSQPYLDAIKEAEEAFRFWNERSDNVAKVYASLAHLARSTSSREFQIFWANMEVLKPSIYQRPPVPVVVPRHSDTGEVPRLASELLERALAFDVENDDLHGTLLGVRDDMALFGRGVAWVLDDARAIYVARRDFVHEPARRWQEVGWVARRAYLTKQEGVERFGDVFKAAQENEIGSDRTGGETYKSTKKKVPVWEVWSRDEQKVVWVTEGIDVVLDEQPPLIDVKGFYPCPEPAYSTKEPETLKPVPDYAYYQDQVEEINSLTRRIHSLSESLRMKGFYPSGVSEVGEAIEAVMSQTDDRTILVGVSSMAALGGQTLKDSIIWLPVVEVAATIRELVALRKQLIEDVYEITGLSDIMRGVTQATETLGAQQLKAEFGSVRVREKQHALIGVALGILRIKAEIMSETFDIYELQSMAGMQIPTAEQSQMQAMQTGQQPEVSLEDIDALLKSDKIRPFLLDVETDSTIAPDENAEKQRRTEFLGAVGTFIGQTMPMVQEFPQAAPFLGELMRFGAGGFRAGRELGQEIDQFIEQVKALSEQQGQDQGPSEEMQKHQSQIELEQVKMQAARDKEMAQMEADLQVKSAEIEAKARSQADELASKALLQEQQMAQEQSQHEDKMLLEREKLALERLKITSIPVGGTIDAAPDF